LHRIVVTAVSAAAVAGVGGTALAATAPSSTRDKALFAYASCMRAKGVDIPDPVRQAGGTYAFGTIPASITGAAGVKAKAQTCATTAGLGGARSTGARPPQTPAQLAARAKFTACLEQHGVTIPRPTGTRPATTRTAPSGKSGAPGRQRGFGGGFSSNPKFQAAFAACRSLSPFGGASNRPAG
jgi:hypothetical protein